MNLKEIVVADTIRGDPVLATAVERATQALLRNVGPTGAEVGAYWEREQNGTGIPKLVLTLRHPTTTVAARFTPEELTANPDLEWRLNRLWGDFLQQLSHEYLKSLRQTVQQLEGD
jgi:hypothetical protein